MQFKTPLSEAKKDTKEIRKSLTDPDSGFMKRPGKPRGFYYLSHQTCDSKKGIITDVHVTAGNVTDSTVHSKRICHQIKKFNFKPESICADAGYDSSEIHKDMLDRNIQTYIPKKSTPTVNKDIFNADCFAYDEEKDVLICPNNKELKFSTFKAKDGAKRYKSTRKQCENCEFRDKCISGEAKYRQVERAYHKIASEKQHKADGSIEYLAAMRLRKIYCEGNFSHQKARHNLSRLNKIGLGNANMHCLLSACAFNLNRMVKLSFA